MRWYVLKKSWQHMTFYEKVARAVPPWYRPRLGWLPFHASPCHNFLRTYELTRYCVSRLFYLHQFLKEFSPL